MKTIYPFSWGFFLATHISLLTAMDTVSLHNDQICNQLCHTLTTQDDQLLPVVNSSQHSEFDEEKSMMSTVTSSTPPNFIEYSFPGHNSLSSMYAIVSNLSRRIDSLEETVAQKDRQIGELQAKVTDFEQTKKLYSGIYREFPFIVKNMHVFNEKIHYLNERASYQKSFIINQAAIVKQNEQNLAEFIKQHQNDMEEVEDKISEQRSRQDKMESISNRLYEAKNKELQSNKTRLEKELKANSASMKALAAINSHKQARGKKRALSLSSDSTVVDQNFDLMLDIDLESLDGFYSQAQEVSMPSNSTTVSVTSQESSNSTQSTPLHVAKKTRLASEK